MKWILITIVAAGIISLGFISSKKKSQKSAKNTIAINIVKGSYAPVAVLELFTSQGCSSCPSADRLLPQLAALDVNVIPLSFHVDYWNRLGWTDPFSSSDYSERQRDYARQLNLESVYTPQLVINGEYELVGSNRSNAEAVIKKVLKEKSFVQIDISDVTISDNQVSFTATITGEYKKTNLLAALVQKQATLKIKAGENGGATLSHTNIVRALATQNATSKNSFKLEIPEKMMNSDWLLVIYAQQKNDLKITGASLYKPE